MNKSEKRAVKICLTHSIAALCAGALFYIFLRQHTYMHSFLGISGFGLQISNFVSGWLGDFLWSYALCFMLFLIWHGARKGLVISAFVTVAFGTALELLQKAGIISGTFDILDIIAETVAALAAVIIIKRSIKK